VISKTPPPVRRRPTLAAGWVFKIRSRAAIARGSYPHIPQYSISISIFWASSAWLMRLNLGSSFRYRQERRGIRNQCMTEHRIVPVILSGGSGTRL
jgi:hypothetical protein